MAHSRMLSICLAALSVLVAGEADAQVSAQIDQLIASQKYQSAYAAMDAIDPKNDNPDIFAKKADIVLQDYAFCINEELFSLKDLEPGETVLSVRGSPGNYPTYTLNIAKEATKLIQKFPKNGTLLKVLGDFYFYGSQSCAVDPDLRKEALPNYLKAEELGAADEKTYFNMGVLYLEQGKFDDALLKLNEALKRNDHYADTYYNIAFAQQQLSHKDQVAPNAVKAFNLYQDKADKSEAAMLAADGYYLEQDKDNVLKYAALADASKDRNDYEILSKLMSLYLPLAEWDKAYDVTDRFFALQPGNPKLTQDIVETYAHYKLDQQLGAFFERNLPKYRTSPQGHGNLLFHQALFFEAGGNKKKALEDFEQARKDFASDPKTNEQALQATDIQLIRLRKDIAVNKDLH